MPAFTVIYETPPWQNGYPRANPIQKRTLHNKLSKISGCIRLVSNRIIISLLQGDNYMIPCMYVREHLF
jgi:hypothetical protein